MTQMSNLNIVGRLKALAFLRLLKRMMLEADILFCISYCQTDIRINTKIRPSDLWGTFQTNSET